MGDEETQAPPTDDTPADSASAQPDPIPESSMPEPSYTPRPALGEFLMTVERGLHVVQEAHPSFEHKGSDQVSEGQEASDQSSEGEEP